MHILTPTHFLGRSLASRHLPHLFVSDNVYRSNLVIAPHAHEHPFLAVCISGGYNESIGTVTYDRRPSTVAFHRPQEGHANRMGRTGARVVSIELSPSIERLLRMCSAQSTDLRPIAPVLPRMLGALRADDTAAALVLEACALEIVAEIVRPARTGGRGWLARVIREIDERYAEPWSMAALAEVAGVHPVHLAREFRRTTGKTVGQYVRELRIRRACEELRATSLSIEEIALRAGFADQSHLSRWIRRTTGLSPRDIRRFARPKR